MEGGLSDFFPFTTGIFLRGHWFNHHLVRTVVMALLCFNIATITFPWITQTFE